MNWSEHVRTDASGRPLCGRIGVPVGDVLAALAEAGSIDAVASRFPGLTAEEVLACAAYASELIASTLPLSTEEDAGLTAALASLRAGRGIPNDEARRRIDDIFKP